MLEIDDIVEKVRLEHNWSEEDAARYASDYLDFLGCAVSTPTWPSVEVDALWHAHILHTRRYRADCYELTGRFIDHEPLVGPSGRADCTPPVNCERHVQIAGLPPHPGPQCVRPGPVPGPRVRTG